MALRICLIYQVVRFHKDEYARMYHKILNQALRAQNILE